MSQFRKACLRAISITIAAGALSLAFWSGAEAGKFKVLHSFCAKSNCSDGSIPTAALLRDSSGNLFGTSDTGGTGNGVVFELQQTTPGKFKYLKIHTFCRKFRCQDGSNPSASLIIDMEGNLYGTTRLGGFGDGVAFKLSPVDSGKWSEMVLYDFCHGMGCADGSTPVAGLTYAGASSGNPYDGVSPLFGTTAQGGLNNQGTVFSLVPNGDQWTESVLYSFCSVGGSNCTDGQMPIGGLLVDQLGNIYGTTPAGGVNHKDGDGAGVAYELSRAGNGQWTQTVLYQFCSKSGCSDGEFPNGDLRPDGAGNLIGTALLGGNPCNPGPFGCGTIFKLVPNGTDSQETVLYAFCEKRDCKDGAVPEGGVSLDPNGNLFGTTTIGGGNDIDQDGVGGGVVYELSGSTYTVLHRFCSKPGCADGEEPEAGVIIDSSGNLYGTAAQGGAFATGGDVFEVHP
jgi:uncharacterized repeat protein (TIGR03803 family)